MANHSQGPENNAKFLALFLDEAEAAISEFDGQDLRDLELPKVIAALSKLLGASSTIHVPGLSSFLRQAAEAMDYFLLSGQSGGEDQLGLARDVLVTLKAWFVELRKDPEHVADASAVRSRIKKLNPDSGITDAELEPPKPKPKLLGEALVEKKLLTPEQVDKAVKIQERKLGQVLVDEGMISRETLDKTLNQIGKGGDGGSVKKVGEQIRVPASRIDELLKIVGELSIHQSIVWHARQTGRLNSRAAQNAITLSHKIIREVQTQVMALRLQPLKSLFQKMERVARDVALNQNKKVDVRVEGGEVDLDKAVIEKITDPLQHMVRNGLDHGIEEPVERESAGKPPSAMLSIVAVAGPSEVQITVSDDGRGMDPKRLIAKGIEKGFLKPGAELRDEDAYNLIFIPGFSTAEQITEFSGRGVGMDVVNQVIRDLGGSISIRSEVGRGTTFTINLPTSVSLMDAVIFYVDGLRYVVPMRDLLEVVDIMDYKLEGSDEHGFMMNLRGRVVPVERLHHYLVAGEGEGWDAEASHYKDLGRPALLVDTAKGPVAFEVDAIAGQQQIVVRNLSGNMAKIPGCVGGTILGDGEPGMILGLPGLARDYFDHISGERSDPS